MLDDRREVGRRDLGHLEPTALALQRPPVGAALDGRGSRQHPDVAVLGDRRGDLGLGIDDGDHVDAVVRRHLADRVGTRRRRRVAGDDEQLRAAVEQQPAIRLTRSRRSAGSLMP